MRIFAYHFFFFIWKSHKNHQFFYFSICSKKFWRERNRYFKKMKKKDKNIDNQDEEMDDVIKKEIASLEKSVQQQTESIKEFIEFHKKNHFTSPPNSTILTLIQLLEKEVDLNKANREKFLQLFSKYLKSNFNNFRDVLEFCVNLVDQIQNIDVEKEVYITKITEQKKKIKQMKKDISQANDKLTNSSNLKIENNFKKHDIAQADPIIFVRKEKNTFSDPVTNFEKNDYFFDLFFHHIYLLNSNYDWKNH